MLQIINNVIPDAILEKVDTSILDIQWEDGKDTAHGSAKDRKNNFQAITPSPTLQAINNIITQCLVNTPYIKHVVMPQHILQCMLNKHTEGGYYGKHIDRPVRLIQTTGRYVRCDVSCTVFLSDPESYEGGELTIYEGPSIHSLKLPKGSVVLYPTSYLHEVKPVTKGTRICAVTWMHSSIPSAEDREVVKDMFDLNNILAKATDNADIHNLAAKIQNNLLRKWCKD